MSLALSLFSILATIQQAIGAGLESTSLVGQSSSVVLMRCHSGGRGCPQSSAALMGMSHRELVHLVVFCASHIQVLAA